MYESTIVVAGSTLFGCSNEMQVWPKFKSNFLVRTTRQQASKAVSIYTQGEQIF